MHRTMLKSFMDTDAPELPKRSAVRYSKNAMHIYQFDISSIFIFFFLFIRLAG